MSVCGEIIPLVGFVLDSLELDNHPSRFRNAMGLLMGTAAAESGCEHRMQMGQGPARGLWQMEQEDHDDIWKNFLDFRPDIAHRVALFGAERFRNPGTLFPMFEQIAGNSWYACAMARVHYLRVKQEIPPYNDPVAMGQYWKTHYNTKGGEGESLVFTDKYAPLVSLVLEATKGIQHSH